MPDALPDTADGGASAGRYLVTARKYRPQTFGDLVAQEHVARTLRNAILGGRLAHAYLFSGPRGVGKTTAARVLAKAINCQTPLAERPDAEPCRTCEACRSFEAGRALNVIELDAASNNSVNDVRDLRDTVRVPPQGAAKKVYILDEVHMLSASAFNALLKTLEEPPPYVVFIFATTEPHKVLPTILSRTQRFDFRRIQVPEIVGRLRAICHAEGVRADDESLVLIARKGDGALRDALSLFDQAVALCGPDLRGEALREALGVVAADLFFDVTDAAARGDRAGLLATVDGLVRRGYDLREFLYGFAEHLRDLLAARATGHADLIEATEQTRARYLEAARAWAEADLLHLLMLTDEAALAIRDSRQPRLTLELALLKMASLERAADLRDLLARLERFEAAVRSGTPPAPPRSATGAAAPHAPPTSPALAPPAAASGSLPSPPTPAPSIGAPQPAPGNQENAQASPSVREPSAPPFAPPEARRAHAPAPREGDDPRRNDTSGRSDDPGRGGAPGHGDGSPHAPAPSRTAPRSASPPASPPASPSAPADLFGRPALRRPSRPDEPEARAGGDGHAAEATLTVLPADAPFGAALARVRDLWPRLVADVRQANVALGALLVDAAPLRVRRGALEIGLPTAFGVDMAAQKTAFVTERLIDMLGEPPPPLRFVVHEAPAAKETALRADPFERLKQLRQEHPVVRALFERFGAEIVWS